MSQHRHRFLIAGNWKMNGLESALDTIVIVGDRLAATPPGNASVLICPPATLIAGAARRAGDVLMIGGQDCHAEAEGAHTGDVSARMLADAGARYVIVGHSERRADHGESSQMVRAKADAANAAGLIPIICIGETLAEREANRTLDIVGAQIEHSLPHPGPEIVIAYEPVWAIGTGLTPTSAQIAEVHGFIRDTLTDSWGAEAPSIKILYGGSMKPGNAGEILAVANVDGGLIGGASLEAESFLSIVSAAESQA